MQAADWQRLTAPFALEAVTWRVLELSQDALNARVKPRLQAEALIERLDEVAGPSHWSLSYAAFGTEAVACNLSVADTSKGAVVEITSFSPPEQSAAAAFAEAAELFKLRPPLNLEASYWVAYDPENRVILHEPEVAPVEAPQLTGTPMPQKSEGQQAIDRIVDRLRAEGLGLEAAKLLVAYGGYGSNPETARELYAALRQLLKSEATAS